MIDSPPTSESFPKVFPAKNFPPPIFNLAQTTKVNVFRFSVFREKKNPKACQLSPQIAQGIGLPKGWSWETKSDTKIFTGKMNEKNILPEVDISVKMNMYIYIYIYFR